VDDKIPLEFIRVSLPIRSGSLKLLIFNRNNGTNCGNKRKVLLNYYEPIV
jgi:hypothetical protein